LSSQLIGSVTKCVNIGLGVILGKVATRTSLENRGINLDLRIYPVCVQEDESASKIFFTSMCYLKFVKQLHLES